MTKLRMKAVPYCTP